MKRTVIFILSSLLLLGALLFPAKVQAATLTSKAGAVTTKAGSLNVRAEANANSSVVSSLQKGSYITLLSRNGAWWQVAYGNKQYGYCYAAYITIVEGTPVTVATQSGSLNVRNGAGTSFAKIASLSKGEAVIRLTTANGWSRVLYHGIKTGYVSAAYLSGNDVISLNVPNFKQTDSRWANVTLGTSGKTIAKIGCATTAIAMMESYRTGTTIYPDSMSKNLRYTSTGSVYWPDNFVVTTNSTGYLNRIYQLLQQGRPVLLGAKNAYGGQHWVVVTGFTGGSFTAENFSIHDPGSSARINLQQFLNAYPNFYKYFYYQ